MTSIGLGEDGPKRAPAGGTSRRPARHSSSPGVPTLRHHRDHGVLGARAAGACAAERTRAHPTEPSPAAQRSPRCAIAAAAGAYELLAADGGQAQVSLFASGSEVTIAVEARRILATRGIPSRVVSVPCIELLLELPERERAATIGTAPVKVAIEAAVHQGWDAVIGSDGLFVGMTDFGASAPYKELFTRFGITPDKVAEAAQSALVKR